MEMGIVKKLCAPLNRNFNMEDDDTLLDYWGDAYGSNILDPDAAHLVIFFLWHLSKPFLGYPILSYAYILSDLKSVHYPTDIALHNLLRAKYYSQQFCTKPFGRSV
jgi:hypothetical protein